MQKLIVSILCIFIIAGSAYAKSNSGKFNQGVLQYKSANYIDAMETMKEVVKSDPGNAVAHYYLAITYVNLGMKKEATKEYNNVISLNPSSQLVEYAQQGLGYLKAAQDDSSSQQSADAPQASETQKPIITQQSSEMSQPSEMKQPAETAKPMGMPGTSGMSGMPNPAALTPQLPSLKYIEDASNKKSLNQTPSKEQIAQAMQILATAGMSQSYNPEAMEMNMLMNSLGGQNMNGMNSGYGNNSMSSMMPMMMMMAQGNNQKMDPQLMETMMTTMMMPGMMQLGGSSNNENNY